MTRGKRHFGQALESVLDSRGLRQKDLAEMMNVSAAYVSATATGRKGISPERIEGITAALSLSREEEVKLHRAAAKDQGFRLDLPEDF